MEYEATIVDGKILISISIENLAHAAMNGEYFFACAEEGSPLRITNPSVFAESVALGLNREEEDGSTPVTRLLDDAIKWVCEQGEEGVDEVCDA